MKEQKGIFNILIFQNFDCTNLALQNTKLFLLHFKIINISKMKQIICFFCAQNLELILDFITKRGDNFGDPGFKD